MFCTQSAFVIYCWLIQEHKTDPTFRRCRPTPDLLRRKLSPSDDQHHVGSDKIDEVPITKPVGWSSAIQICSPHAIFTYFFPRVFRSMVSSRYVVRSLMVSDDVVPLIVSSKKISPMQSSNLFHNRCVVSLGRLLRSMRHLPMLMLREHATTSSSWSSSNRCKSNCSSHLARGDVLLLYFSLPNLMAKIESAARFI